MNEIAKTELTIELEKIIWEETRKTGVFGCFEVTIGWAGDERVDYMTYDTKGIFRCYEIKVSKSDFNSNAKKTFVGHYNYYVMPLDLYNSIKDVIPDSIGVYVGGSCIKKARRKELAIEEQVLKDSMIRSLSRENEKFRRTCDTEYILNLKNKIIKAEKEASSNDRKYKKIYHALGDICDKYNLDFREVRQFVREQI